MKDFKGQYADEKLLLKQHESKISFLIGKWYLFIVYIIFVIIIILISKYFDAIIYGIIFSIVVLFIFFLYLRRMYKNTWLIITSRRVIKLVRNGIFMQHRKELKLMDIKASTSRRGFIDTIFGYGVLMVQGTEGNSNIYFKGIKGHSDITNYIGRVLDYIKLNGHTDNISRYKSKKER